MSDNELNISLNVTETGTESIDVLRAKIVALRGEIDSLLRQSSQFATTTLVSSRKAEIDAIESQIVALKKLKSAATQTGEELIAQNKDEVASSRMVSQARLDDAAAMKRANVETVASINQALAVQERAAQQLISQNRDEVASATMVMRFQREQAAQAARLAAEQAAMQRAVKVEKEVGTSSSMIIRAQRGIDTRPQEPIIGRGLNTVQILAAQKATQSMVESMEKVEDAAQKVEFPGRGLNTTEILRARNLTSGLEQDLKLLGTTAATGGSEAAAASVGRGTSLALHEMRHVVAGMDELARGQRGAFFSTLGAASRDAGLGVAGLATSVGTLVTIMGVMAVGHAAQKMAEFAQNSRNAAAAAGMSVTQFSELQGALQLTGMKADSADTALRQFGEHVGEALANPTSKAAEAFHALGISQDFLNSHANDTHGIFLAVSDSLSKFADTATKAEAQETLFGKGAEKITDLTQRGAKGVQALEAQAKSLGITLTDQTAESLIEVGQKMDTLGAVTEGSAMKAFIAWAPTISSVITLLTGLITVAGEAASAIGGVASAITKIPTDLTAGMTTQQHGHWGKQFGRDHFINDPVQSQTTQPVSSAITKPIVPAFGQKGAGALQTASIDDQIAQAKDQAALKSSTPSSLATNELKAEIGVIQQVISKQKELGLSAVEVLHLQAEASRDQAQLRGDNLRQETASYKKGYQEFAAQERLKIQEAKGNSSQIQSIYQEWLDTLKKDYVTDLTDYRNVQRLKIQAAQQAAEEMKRAQIKSIQEGSGQTDQLANALSSQAQLQGTLSGNPKGKDSQTGDEAAGQQIMADAMQKVQQLMQYTNQATNSVQTQQAAWMAISQIIGDAESKVNQLIKNSGVLTTGLMGALTTVLQSFTSQMDSFSQSLTKAVLAPQQELIHAGLTTIKVNLRGQELKQAAQKLFLGMADDLVSSAQKGLMKLATQQLLKIPAVSHLMGSGAAASKGADFGASTANLTAFNTALKAATQALGQAVPAQTRNTVALHTSAPAQTTNTAALHAHTTATSTSAGALAIHAPATHIDTTATTTHTSGVLANAAAFLGHTIKVIADEIATEADVVVKWAEAAFEQGGIVPSAAGGMVVGGASAGGRGVRAILHAKEMVLPAHLSEGIQGIIQQGSGRSSSVSNAASLTYAPQINSGKGGMSRAEFGQMLSSHAGTMVGEARNLIRQGWRP